MPTIDVVIYRESADEAPPLVAWLDSLQDKARERCLAQLEMLAGHGHDLDRPRAAYLGDGIYELRVKFYRVNYRMLYFFHGRTAAVVSHGLAKERRIPPREIELAAGRMARFKSNPSRHTFRPERE